METVRLKSEGEIVRGDAVRLCKKVEFRVTFETLAGSIKPVAHSF